ncbi:hypothetical protein HJ590_17820 [Naumannella sp. ID2617S]|nr:hypothetical protein [Naumannella sp. ID2617S]
MSRPGDQEPPLPEPGHRPMPGDEDYVPTEERPPGPPAPPRKKVPLPVLVLGIGVLVAALVVFFFFLRGQLNRPLGDVDPSPTPTLVPRSGTPAPVQHGAVGQRMTVEGLYGKGTILVLKAEWSDKGDLPPDPGRQYLNLELRYDCTEGTMVTSNNFYAVYDTRKTEYLPGIGAGKQPLGDGELKAGQSRQGWVSVEMPPGPALVVISDEGINPLVILEVPKP